MDKPGKQREESLLLPRKAGWERPEKLERERLQLESRRERSTIPQRLHCEQA